MGWLEENQRHLLAHVARVRSCLAGAPAEAVPTAGSERVYVLDGLSDALGLTPFERDVVVAAAAAELDGGVPPPTVGALLAAMPDAHWSAFAPSRPLRWWRLVTLDDRHAFVDQAIRLDERVLHGLLGTVCPDERVLRVFEPLAGQEVAVSQRAAVTVAVRELRGDPPPIVHLDGDATVARAIAAAVGATLGTTVWVAPMSLLPVDPGDVQLLARLLEREAAIDGAAVLLLDDDPDPAQARAAARLAGSARCPVLLAGHRPRHGLDRPVVTVEVAPPTAAERARTWREAVGASAVGLNGALDDLAHAFPLHGQDVRSATALALAGAGGHPITLGTLRAAARRQARGGLDALAQRIEPVAGWDDLVIPEQQRRTLEELAAHVRHRRRVQEDWGFGARSSRGLAVSALFSGPSGTGKTMAAEVIANELGFDLYRIDLSATVSKYIGDTEKNLRVLFDRAERGSAVLLFDEADALFGRRSEVHDAHDRHANIEVSYLLQRMETYRGLAVLTTNLPDHLDDAFLRRLRYVVPFPFPDAAARAEMWRRAFPAATPCLDLDVDVLAGLNVSGGSITNIALGAAALAAADGGAVTMHHLLRAARTEYAKLAKPLTATELRGWELVS